MFVSCKCQLACWAIVLVSLVVLADATPEFKIGAYRFRQELRSEAAFRDMKAAGVDFVIDEFHRDKPSLEQMRRLGLSAEEQQTLLNEISQSAMMGLVKLMTALPESVQPIVQDLLSNM